MRGEREEEGRRGEERRRGVMGERRLPPVCPAKKRREQ